MDCVNLQKQIRDNAEDIRTYANSLKDFEKEMKDKEKQLLDMNKSVKDTSREERILNHEKADNHKKNGNEFVKHGKWKDAIDEYSAAISLYPDDAIYYGNRSYCFMQLKKWEDAENDCTRSLELKSDYVKVALRRANIRKIRGNLPGAAKDYNLVLILEPKNSTALKEYEELYPELKKYYSELGINLPEFIEMNPSLKPVQEDEPKILDKLIINKNTTKSLNSVSQQKLKDNKVVESVKIQNSKKTEEKKKKIEDYEIIYPEKYIPPHLRSKLPLKRIKIEDVYSNNDDEFNIF
ncbi:hypothetical protein O3M35_000638 [Rhynocoris fuscipes]|uniref:TPR-like protein n=1 Tax=Rhynocoris fuscipes TaxID=488301 RepID=A0AAW1DT46_9HEMI